MSLAETVVAGIVLSHSILHFMAFTDQLPADNASGFITSVPGHHAWFWLLAGLLWLLTSVLIVQAVPHWVYLAWLSVCISQILVIIEWTKRKWGTLVNIFIMVLVYMLQTAHFDFIPFRR